MRRGYTVVIQDQRGRYASDGEFRWMFRDRLETFDVEDGFDAAEWAARLTFGSRARLSFGSSGRRTTAMTLLVKSMSEIACFSASPLRVPSASMNSMIN